MLQVTAEETRDRLEHAGRARGPEAGPGKAVGRALPGPGRRGVPVERGGECGLVLVDAPGEDGIGREAGRDPRLVDPVAREWIDQPRRVADEQDATSYSGGAEPPHGKAMPADVAQLPRVEPVGAREALEMHAQLRAL